MNAVRCIAAMTNGKPSLGIDHAAPAQQPCLTTRDGTARHIGSPECPQRKTVGTPADIAGAQTADPGEGQCRARRPGCTDHADPYVVD